MEKKARRSMEARMLSVMKDSALSCLNASSIHGVPKIVKDSEKLVLKLFWFICVLASLSYCLYMVVLLVQTYFEFRVATSVKEIDQRPVVFPMVAFCHMNYINSPEGYSFARSSVNETNPSSFEEIEYLANLVRAKSRYENATLKQANGMNITQMLISCTFATLPCSWEDFEPFFDLNFGNCYKFNSGRSFNGSSRDLYSTPSQGYIFGLNIQLFVGLQTTDNYLETANGLVILVANQTSFPAMFDYGTFVSPGKLNHIAIRRTLTNRLAAPYSTCIMNTASKDAYDSDFYRLTFNYSSYYDQNLCLKMVYQYSLITECGCQDIFTFILNDMRGCQESNDTTCYDRVKMTLVDEATFEDQFLPSCPPACDTSQYELKISGALFPSPYYASKLRNNSLVKAHLAENATYDEIASSVSMLYVYYDVISYKFYSETPYLTFPNLISSLGGYFGFFMGFSILSFMESIELVIIFWLTLAKKFSHKSRKINQRQLPEQHSKM